MRQISLALLLIVVLAGCASQSSQTAEPSQFQSFEEAYQVLAHNELRGGRWAMMSVDLSAPLIACMTRYMKATLGTADLAKLDMVVRGETTVTDAEANRILAKIDARDLSGLHVWTQPELETRARELGWFGFENAVRQYEASGLLPAAARNKATEVITNAPQFVRNATRDDFAHLEPYCPDIIPKLKRF